MPHFTNTATQRKRGQCPGLGFFGARLCGQRQPQPTGTPMTCKSKPTGGRPEFGRAAAGLRPSRTPLNQTPSSVVTHFPGRISRSIGKAQWETGSACRYSRSTNVAKRLECGDFSTAFRPHRDHPPFQVFRPFNSAAKAGSLQTLREFRTQAPGTGSRLRPGPPRSGSSVLRAQ
jgi:hypothetical protein